MRKLAFTMVLLGLLAGSPCRLPATPAEDLFIYRNYFLNRFPAVPLDQFGNGVYAIDNVSHDTWRAIEEFPPYEPMIDQGEIMWHTPFSNGRYYADCFDGTPAVSGSYPYWDRDRRLVITLPLAINECRKTNGEKPLEYLTGPITHLLAYMGYASRGKKTNVEIPLDDPGAIEAYARGKTFFFSRRGQLNFSCASCHMESSGLHLRTDVLSPALGQTTGWPVYRATWGELGTLHRRLIGCSEQVRAKPFAPQSEQYRDLEYFLAHMSNGIPYNGPSSRK